MGRSRKTRSQNGISSGTLCRIVPSTDRGEAYLFVEDLWLLNSQGSGGKHELTMSSLVAFNLGIQHYDFSTTANSVFSTKSATALAHQFYPLAMVSYLTTKPASPAGKINLYQVSPPSTSSVMAEWYEQHQRAPISKSAPIVTTPKKASSATSKQHQGMPC